MKFFHSRFATIIFLLSGSIPLTAQNVGIGTASPRQKLHVEGNTYIKDSLGIGIDSTRAKLDINGTVLFRGENNNPVSTAVQNAGVEFATGRGYFLSPAPGISKGDIALSYGGPGGGFRHFITSFHYPEYGTYTYNGINFYINSSLEPEGSVSPGSGNLLAMTLTNTGLGIGTFSPYGKLHVEGTSLLHGKTAIGTSAFIYNSSAEFEVSGASLFKGGNPANSYYLKYPKAGVEFLFGRDANGMIFSGYPNSDLAFNYGDFEGGFRHFISTRHENAANTSGNSFDFFVNNSAYRDSSVSPGSGNKLVLAVTGAGVGIGKANPSKAIDVNGSGEVNGDFSIKRMLKTDTISTASRLMIQGNVSITGKLAMGDSVIANRVLKTDTIAATARLNILGNARVSGKLTVSDSLFVNVIAPENIQPASLQNGWINHGGGFTDAGFWKDKEGLVHIQGLIKNGNTAISTVLFTLPPGYRPPARQIYTVLSNNVVSRVDILGNGDVIIANTVNNLWLNLTGIYFRVN